VENTARNWSTAEKLHELAFAPDAK